MDYACSGSGYGQEPLASRQRIDDIPRTMVDQGGPIYQRTEPTGNMENYAYWNAYQTSQHGAVELPFDRSFPLPQSPGQLQSQYPYPQPHMGSSQLPAPMRDISNQISQHPWVTRPRRTSQGTAPYSYRTSAVIGSDRQDILNDEKELYESFMTRPRRFFSKGKVFLTLWSEPAGESGSSAASAFSAASRNSGISNGRFGQRVFSKIRRFVIIREGVDSCTAVPINTYDGQGVSKRGVRKREHAIIYTGRYPPQPMESEGPSRGETGLLPRAIRVDSDSREEKLDFLSRVDFGKVYTIEHNVKVRSLGKINRESEQALQYQFDSVWASTVRSQQSPATPASPALETVSEQSATCSILDWARAFGILMANNFTEEQAVSVLKADPRRQSDAHMALGAPERDSSVHNESEIAVPHSNVRESMLALRL